MNKVVKSFEALSRGLFVSLIIGLLLETFAKYLQLEVIYDIAAIAKYLMGSAIAVSIAIQFSYKVTTLSVAPIVGMIASGRVEAKSFVIGDPLTSFVISVIVLYLLNKLEQGKIYDFFVLPIVGMILSMFLFKYLKPVSNLILSFGEKLSSASDYQLIVVIMTALIFGVAISSPISSAALAIIIGLDGQLAYVAVVATSCQMSSFFTLSLGVNKWSTSLLVLFGSSKLYMYKIIEKPQIIIIPLIVSVICGTMSYYMTSSVSVKEAAGMGLLGLSAQILTLEINGFTTKNILIVSLSCIVIPIILTKILSIMCLKLKVITAKDYELK